MQTELDARGLIQTEPADWSARVYGAQPFAGAGKSNSGLLEPWERKLGRFVLPRIPRWLETYHLTLLTLVWSIGIVVFDYLAASSLRWLRLTNMLFVYDYFTDN